MVEASSEAVDVHLSVFVFCFATRAAAVGEPACADSAGLTQCCPNETPSAHCPPPTCKSPHPSLSCNLPSPPPSSFSQKTNLKVTHEYQLTSSPIFTTYFPPVLPPTGLLRLLQTTLPTIYFMHDKLSKYLYLAELRSPAYISLDGCTCQWLIPHRRQPTAARVALELTAPLLNPSPLCHFPQAAATCSRVSDSRMRWRGLFCLLVPSFWRRTLWTCRRRRVVAGFCSCV